MLPSAQPAVENKTLNSGVPHPNVFSFPFALLHLDGFRVLFSSHSWVSRGNHHSKSHSPISQGFLKEGNGTARGENRGANSNRKFPDAVQDTTPAPNLLRHRKKAA